ncbi:MAG: SDR family oxidoreductase [Chloroflexota bacterium]
MKNKSILITGAASGIGLAATRQLHARGFEIFAGTLPGEDISNLQALAKDRLHILPLDITNSDMIYTTRAKVQQSLGDRPLFGLFNNAGIAISGPLEFIPLDAIRQQMEVNVFGHIAMTQAFLPMLRQSRGRIVNTVSILGRITVAFSGSYCMSKYAMEAFTDALRLELRPFGVHVSAIEPGAINTPLWSKVRDNAEEIAEELPVEGQQLYGAGFKLMMRTASKTGTAGISPDRVAQAVAHAFMARRPRTRYIVGSDARLVAFLRRIVSDRVMDRIMATRYPMMKQPSP